MNQKKSMGIIALAVLAILIAIGGWYYFAQQKRINSSSEKDFQNPQTSSIEVEPSFDGEIVIAYDSEKIRSTGIQFKDKKGQVTKTVPFLDPENEGGFSTAQIAENGTCVVLNNLKGVLTEKGWIIKGSETIIYGISGDILWDFQGASLQFSYLAPTCDYLVGNVYGSDGPGPLKLVNKNGQVSDTIFGVEGDKAGFFEDGSGVVLSPVRITMLTEQVSGKMIPKGDINVLMLNPNGRKLWEKKDILSGFAAHSVDVDIENNQIIVRIGYPGYQRVIFDKKGNRL